MAQKQIGLIVIDSVAAIFRLETDILSRSADMRRLAHSLQRLSDEYGCAIVCINQVETSDTRGRLKIAYNYKKYLLFHLGHIDH